MSMNRQPGPMNEDALQMLHDKELKKGADVITVDGETLGKAIRLHHRSDEIDPDLKLYSSYLETRNLLMGSSFFVPVDFVSEYDPQTAQVTLSVSASAAMQETWDREPTFVAGHLDKPEELAS